MNTIPMRQKVRFYTFDNDRNQGFMKNLGEHEVFLERIATPTLKYWGCASRELVTETVLTVTLSGRTFAVKEGDSVIYRNQDKFEVTLPYGFNPFAPVQKCPTCHSSLDECPTCHRPL